MRGPIIVLLCLILFNPVLTAQENDCKKFHLYADCNVNPGPRYKYDGQSRSNIIGVGDQLIYSLVLYADKEYIINFCASEHFLPVHIKLLDAESDKVMYDNKSDDYMEMLTLSIDKTQRLKIFVEVLAQGMPEEDKLEFFACLGMMVQSKKLE